MSGERPLRADAVRNRQRILDAATGEISAHGSDASMDAIAASAGVAVGTLYRHFPNKSDLVSAVVARYLSEVADDAEGCVGRVTEGGSPADEVIGFMNRVAESTAHIHAVKTAAARMGFDGYAEKSSEARARAALLKLLKAGRKTGQIQAGITVEDIYLLMITTPVDQPRAARQRWLQLIRPAIVTHA